MHKLFLNIGVFLCVLCLSCNTDATQTEETLTAESTVAATPPQPITRIDTVGCVIRDTEHDTLLSKENVNVHFAVQTYCTRQTFWDTTTSAGGKDLTVEYENLALYNYRVIKIKVETGNKIQEIKLTNKTFKDSVSDGFYRRGILDKPYHIVLVPKDTSIEFDVDLFTPGDNRIILHTRITKTGLVNVLSTAYEGAY